MFNYFQEILIATSFEPKVLRNSFRTIFRSLFEDTTITNNFLESHISITTYIEINTLFANFNNKGFETFKVRPNHSILKGMDDG